MNKDKHGKRKPKSNRLVDRARIRPHAGEPASAKLFIPECGKQVKRENATQNHDPNAGRKNPNLMISYDGKCKINKSMQSKEDKNNSLEKFHRVLSLNIFVDA